MVGRTRRRWWLVRRSPGARPRVAVFVCILALVATAGCGGGARWRSPGDTADGGRVTTPTPDPIQFVVNPANGAKDVSPADPVSVMVEEEGRLETVTLTTPDGRQVKGGFDAAQQSWVNAEPLGYAKTYSLSVAAARADGHRQEHTSTFTTVKPGNYTLPYLRANVGMLLDGGTFGVGQPVIVWFDEAVKDKAAAERMLTVTTDRPVEGAWSWLDNREVHWRPKVYWPANTKVTVTAKVYGKHLGGGLYGQEDRSASFTIGQSKIAIADSGTKRMKVFIDGQQITTLADQDVTAGIPISMGKGGTEQTATGVVDFTTNSGPHVVTQKHDVYRMTSASFGITDPKSPNFYDEEIKKAVRISGDGEFVHLADWNIPQHGVNNTSHGCINVAPTYIYWFYDTFGAGDIIDVTGTTRQLDARNGLGDWVVPWDQWVKGSALA